MPVLPGDAGYVQAMEFCTPFDEALAHQGPPGVFLFDAEGALRFQVTWTRDLYGRAPGPHALGWRWTLCRDIASGFVQLVLVTSPTLLTEHPRLELRAFEAYDEAKAALDALGVPAVAEAGWA